MLFPIFNKSTEPQKKLDELITQHDFLSNIKKFPLPNVEEIGFDIDSINTYWVQKDNLGTKKQKKQSSKDEKIENISYVNQNISSKNTYRYMGKVMKTRDSEYSPEFIVGSLQYLFEKMPYGKVNFVIGAKLSEIMNGSTDTQDAMSTSEQIDYIKYYTYQYFPNRIKDLNILTIQDLHPDLFDGLDNNKDNPIETLSVEELPNLDINNISTLEIAQHLYYACQNNPKLDENIRAVTPPNIKEKTESSYYYGLIEIAFRLMDYLNGVSIQGGKYGQGRYDQFIKTIIMGNHDNYGRKELDPLASFCQDILKNKDQKFATIHLKTNEYQKNINEQQIIERQKELKKSKKMSLYKNIAITVLAISTLFGGGYGMYQRGENLEKQKLEEKINLENLKKLKNEPLGYTIGYAPFSEEKDKVLFLERGARNVLYNLNKRYIEVPNSDNNDDLLALIKDELIRSGQLNDISDIDHINKNIDLFIKDHLFGNHTNQLFMYGFNDMPYEQLIDESSSMHNMLSQNDDVIFSTLRIIPPKFKTWKLTINKYQNRDIKELGEYTNQSGGNWKIAYIYKQSTSSAAERGIDMDEVRQKQSGEYMPGNIYFLASTDGETYTKELGLEVINSRLSEGYPLLNDIINNMGQDNIDKNKISAEFIKRLRKGIHEDIDITKQQKIDKFIEFYERQK